MGRISENFFMLVGLAAIGYGGYWLFFSPGETPEEAAARQEAQNAEVCTDANRALLEARFRSHDVVRNGLRSPSTAEFPGTLSSEIDMRRLEGCRWQMVSFVDAQNGFGATVRTFFQVQLTGDPQSGTYQIDEISFLEQ